MSKKVNLEGLRFTRLVIKRYLEKEERDYKLSTWLCECDCGNMVHVSTSHLKNGNVQSCGCLKNDTYVNNKKSNTPEYQSYQAMLRRCSDDSEKFKPYWSKEVCERWLLPNGEGFLNFLSDMGERPEGTTLERKDNSLGYFPDNCKWETAGNQCFNRNLFSNSKSGRTGVVWRNDVQKFRVYINVDGKRINLGTFETFEEAVAVRQSAELKYYGFVKEA